VREGGAEEEYNTPVNTPEFSLNFYDNIGVQDMSMCSNAIGAKMSDPERLVGSVRPTHPRVHFIARQLVAKFRQK
jgi:hypothetical protein